MASVQTLVTGVEQVDNEIQELKKLGRSPAGDRFIPVMEVRRLLQEIHEFRQKSTDTVLDGQEFVASASPAIDALKVMSTTLQKDLKALLVYYREDPASSKPEDLFRVVVSFSSALLVAKSDVEEADRKAGPKNLTPVWVFDACLFLCIELTLLTFGTVSGKEIY